MWPCHGIVYMNVAVHILHNVTYIQNKNVKKFEIVSKHQARSVKILGMSFINKNQGQ